MEDKLKEYCEALGVNGFPFFAVSDVPEEEIINIMQDCIKKGKPYEPKYHPDALY